MSNLRLITSNFLFLFAICFYANANNGILETKRIGDAMQLVHLEEDLTGGTTSSPYQLNQNLPDLQIRWFEEDTVKQPGFSIDNREKTDSGMYFEVTQPQGEFYSFGFDFGDNNGDEVGGSPYTVDLTHQSIHLRFKTKNLGDSVIQFLVALVDIYGNQVNTFKYNIDGDIEYNLDPVYAGYFRMDLSPEEEGYIEDALEEGYLDMQQGYFKYWSGRDSAFYCRPCHDITDENDGDNRKFINENFYRTGLRTFDYSKVKGFLITVANVRDTGPRDSQMNAIAAGGPLWDEYNSYLPLALNNYPVLLTELSIDVKPMSGNISYRTNPDEYNDYDTLTYCSPVYKSINVGSEVCKSDSITPLDGYYYGDGITYDTDSNSFFDPSLVSDNTGLIETLYNDGCGIIIYDSLRFTMIDCDTNGCVPLQIHPINDEICVNEFEEKIYSLDPSYNWSGFYQIDSTLLVFDPTQDTSKLGVIGTKYDSYYNGCGDTIDVINKISYVFCDDTTTCEPVYRSIPIASEVCNDDSITYLQGYFEGDGISYDIDSNSYFDPSLVSLGQGVIQTWYNDGCGNIVFDSLMFTVIDCEQQDTCLAEIVELPSQLCQNYPSILLNKDKSERVSYFGDGIVYKNGYSLFYSSNLPLNYDAFIIAERFNQCTNVYEIDTIITRIVDCSDSVSAIGETEEIEVKLSPNPVIDYINISSELNFETYTIYSMSGEIVLEGEIYSESIEMAELKKGSYILMLQSENQIIRKVIVKD